MKKFEFKLEALLKMRRLEEEKCKLEIGRAQVELAKVKDKLAQNEKDIEDFYADQEEKLARDHISASQLQLMPYLVTGRKASHKELEKEIAEKEESLKEFYEELTQLRAAVKVLETLREKEEIAFKKMRNKKIEADIEEQFIIQNKFGK